VNDNKLRSYELSTNIENNSRSASSLLLITKGDSGRGKQSDMIDNKKRKGGGSTSKRDIKELKFKAIVKRCGNSGAVTVPRQWIDREVWVEATLL
jgi:putative transposon-encoded protein